MSASRRRPSGGGRFHSNRFSDHHRRLLSTQAGGPAVGPAIDPALATLAAAHGVLVTYRDARGRLCTSPEHAVRAVLAALGEGAARRTGTARQTGAQTEEESLLPPVLVAWEGRLPELPLRLAGQGKCPDLHRVRALRVTCTTEEGEEHSWELRSSDLAEDRGQLAGLVSRLGGARLPWGKHILRVELQEEGRGAGSPRARGGGLSRANRLAGEAVVISAPRRCFTWGDTAGAKGAEPLPPGAERLPPGAGLPAAPCPEVDPLQALDGRPWGVFCPTYALRSRRDWGAGDLADLGLLCDWVGQRGGAVVATLPLLARVREIPFDPSPYRPSSRLFWNEFYLAIELLPEWERCPSARLWWESPAVQTEWARLRELSLVDYEAVAALKARALSLLAACFFAEASEEERRTFADFVAGNPWLEAYARFQAAQDTKLAPSTSLWADGVPQENAIKLLAAREGRAWARAGNTLAGEGGAAKTLVGEGGAGKAMDALTGYHLYCQWRMEQQLAALRERAGTGLLLDLPLGVHPQGFDVHQWPGLFVKGVSSGAPPDDFFAEGQVWDSPPLHPEADRRNGYRYLSACLATQMRHATCLRLDHVMSFHRLFWVPAGMSAADGVYVTYPAEEMYAVLSLESHRHHCEVVGEDLGTVPAGVRPSLRRHGIARTWVLQGALQLQKARAISLSGRQEEPREQLGARLRVDSVPAGAVAMLNTHDMVPFAGYLQGDDLRRREESGALTGAAARSALAARRRLVRALACHFALPGNHPLSQGETKPTDEKVMVETEENPVSGLLARVLAWLARSPARLVLVNLEDVWGETEPQNTPGTGSERPNWRRKIACSLEELRGTGPGGRIR